MGVKAEVHCFIWDDLKPSSYLLGIRHHLEYTNASCRYNLGPNGGILTALNLFTTKFDQVLDLVEKRADSLE